jgi:hypothetical protein
MTMTTTHALIPGDRVRTVNYGEPATGTIVRKSTEGSELLVDLDDGPSIWAGWDTCTRIVPVPADPIGFLAETLRDAFAKASPVIERPDFTVLGCDFCGSPMGFVQIPDDGCGLLIACSAACRERLES